jgi:hypothetical protein
MASSYTSANKTSFLRDSRELGFALRRAFSREHASDLYW